MKNIIIAVALFATAFISNTYSQDKQPLQKVITSYLDLKNALTKDDLSGSSAAAEVLYNTINDLPMDKLTSEQHDVWMKYYKKLSKDADHIKDVPDIDHHREHFAKLSVNMYKLIVESKGNTIDLYYQYCSMKKAYWLSEKSEIVNPYYSKMTECCSTKETLNANK